MTQELSREEILRYSRHLLIPEVGMAGQRKLKQSSVLIVGTGGLGSPAALYLAAAGVGRIGLVDFDVVEISNLQRQVLHGTSMIGKAKVESARIRLNDLNPMVQVDIYNEPFTSVNAKSVAEGFDIILDGTDNFPTRYLINDLCVLTRKPFVYGAVFRFDGQVSLFDAKKGPCYRCLFPDPPHPGVVPSCSDAGVLGILPGTIGTIQATETIKWLLGIGSAMTGRLLLYNALDLSFDFVNLKKNAACRICGGNPDVTDLIDYYGFCGVPGPRHDAPVDLTDDIITVQELARKVASSEIFQLIDVREPHELAISSFPQAENIPMGTLAGRLAEMSKTDEIILFCRTGTRSQQARDLLLAAGFTRVRSLYGGINAWAREIDQRLPVY